MDTKYINTESECHIAAGPNDTLLTLKAIAYTIIILTATCGNFIVLYVIYRTKSMRTVTNLLICNTALADLLIILFPATWEILDTYLFKSRWPLGSFMCVVKFMCTYISVAANVISMIVITFDRYCAVMLPYDRVLKKTHLYGIIPLIWLVAFGFASPTIFAQKVYHVDNIGLVCGERWEKPFYEEESPKHYTLVLFLFLYATPLCLMSVMYAIMAAKLQKSGKMIKESSSKTKKQQTYVTKPQTHGPLIKTHLQVPEIDTHTTSKVKKRTVRKKTMTSKRRRVIKMLISLVFVFAVCWLPVYCIQFITFFHPYFIKCQEAIPEWAYFLAFWLQYANAAINPLLYFGFSESYRKGFRSSFPILYKNKDIISKLHRKSPFRTTVREPLVGNSKVTKSTYLTPSPRPKKDNLAKTLHSTGSPSFICRLQIEG